ncbi:MAG: lipoprotein-releasing system ATP-binding protein [Verrucomicrobiales bacterium]|jgi:lipoprotein-releasing system ATP-binding protein
MIELDSVTKAFPDAAGGEPRVVIDGISLAVAGGERLAIVGSSGCGKSTLLNLMGTLDLPTSGEVKIGGRAVSGMGEKELAALRSETIGFIFQLHHLLPQATVIENVMLPSLALRGGSPQAEVRERAETLLERVGMSGQRDQKPHQLSGGERQRVAVVRALINKPGVILADEPTGALDQARAGELADLLVDLNEQDGVALVMVTHDPGLAQRMGRVLRIVDGKLEERM